MKINALSIMVYRGPLGDCTNNGISSRYNTLLVACPDGNHVIDTDFGIPDNFCHLRRRELFGGTTIVYDIRPADVSNGEIIDRGRRWYMMGGNFAYTSDGRFRDMLKGFCGAVPIHDRVENN